MIPPEIVVNSIFLIAFILIIVLIAYACADERNSQKTIGPALVIKPNHASTVDSQVVALPCGGMMRGEIHLEFEC